jgi:hypothetical protein
MQNGKPIVVLNAFKNGRLIEIPHRGLFLIEKKKAQAMAAEGKCQPLNSLGGSSK